MNLTRDYPLERRRAVLYRQVTGGRLPVSSLLIPILAGEQNLGVLVLDNFNTRRGLQSEDETLLMSLSQQVALSLENVRLMQATQDVPVNCRRSPMWPPPSLPACKAANWSHPCSISLLPVLPYDTATFWLREKDQLTVNAARGFPDTEQLVWPECQVG